jgi:hypothetical protein
VRVRLEFQTGDGCRLLYHAREAGCPAHADEECRKPKSKKVAPLREAAQSYRPPGLAVLML